MLAKHHKRLQEPLLCTPHNLRLVPVYIDHSLSLSLIIRHSSIESRHQHFPPFFAISSSIRAAWAAKESLAFSLFSPPFLLLLHFGTQRAQVERVRSLRLLSSSPSSAPALFTTNYRALQMLCIYLSLPPPSPCLPYFPESRAFRVKFESRGPPPPLAPMGAASLNCCY